MLLDADTGKGGFKKYPKIAEVVYGRLPTVRDNFYLPTVCKLGNSK